MYSVDNLMEPISFHYSFIIRCWRDTNGLLRGWVVDALTQRSHPFTSGQEISARIDSLTQNPQHDEVPSVDGNKFDESH
jgi:hypothetical protein